MVRYDFVFVVLVYRNICDIEDFFTSLKTPNTKVIVVNSYYDDASELKFKQIANKYAADFISVPNKGYGAGNNAGISHALKNYEFDFLIVSNADITIETLNICDIKKYGNSIIAPKIINLKGKNQNPSAPFQPSLIHASIKAKVLNGYHRKLIWILFAYSRFLKCLYYLISPFRKKIFSAHGAFVIISKGALVKLTPLYNEDMFLFNEEEWLGLKAFRCRIKTFYAREVVIRHKEDGSMKLASIDEFERMRQSYLVYYNNGIRKYSKYEK